MAGMSTLTCVLWRIRILMLECEKLNNDDCDTCTENLSLLFRTSILIINLM